MSEDLTEEVVENTTETVNIFSGPCNEWNELFGVAGAAIGINCKKNQGHEDEHEVVITIGVSHKTQHVIRWSVVL